MCRRRISYFVSFEVNINAAPSFFHFLTSAPHWLTTAGKHNKRHINGSKLRTRDCSEVTPPVSRVSVRVRSAIMTKSQPPYSTSLPDMMLHKCPCCFCNRTCVNAAGYTLDTCGLLCPWPRWYIFYFTVSHCNILHLCATHMMLVLCSFLK